MTAYLQIHTLNPPLIWKRPALNLGMSLAIPLSQSDNMLFWLHQFRHLLRGGVDVEFIFYGTCEWYHHPELEVIQASLKKLEKPGIRFHCLILDYDAMDQWLAEKMVLDECAWRLSKVRKSRGWIGLLPAGAIPQKDALEKIGTAYNGRRQQLDWEVIIPKNGIDYNYEVYEGANAVYRQWLANPAQPNPCRDVLNPMMLVRNRVYQDLGGWTKDRGEGFGQIGHRPARVQTKPTVHFHDLEKLYNGKSFPSAGG